MTRPFGTKALASSYARWMPQTSRFNVDLADAALHRLYADQESNDARTESLEFGSEQSIDILTWNIEAFPKEGFASAASTGGSSHRPSTRDVVAIQEVWSQAHLEWVAQTLGTFQISATPESEATGLYFLFDTRLWSLSRQHKQFYEPTHTILVRGHPFRLTSWYMEQASDSLTCIISAAVTTRLAIPIGTKRCDVSEHRAFSRAI